MQKPEQEKKTVWIDCPNCDGSGVCFECGGEGWLEAVGYMEVDVDCEYCRGDGSCWDCGGYGRIEIEEEDE